MDISELPRSETPGPGSFSLRGGGAGLDDRNVEGYRGSQAPVWLTGATDRNVRAPSSHVERPLEQIWIAVAAIQRGEPSQWYV